MDILVKNFLNNPVTETIIKLLRHMRCNNYHHLVVYIGTFISRTFPSPLHKDIYEEIGISSYYSNNFELSYKYFSKILSFFNLSETESKLSIFNRHFSSRHISNNYIFYNEKIVQKVLNRPESSFKLITFTVTSCKRLKLFKQTMNSFLNCCIDVNKIDRWICVDDNSSIEDRKEMERLYPFFEFYWKNFDEKGHPQSMNIIKKIVTTPFIFHLEDDWKFFAHKKYIQECLSVLDSNKTIGQCLINRNYSETIDGINIKGGKLCRTKQGLRFYLHEQLDANEYHKKYGKSKNVAYWPHFSFRPSLLRKKVFDDCGYFDEKISHFELDYANKYIKRYKSAFLEGIYCLHIGRLTSQRNNKAIPNAYDLNNEQQFSGKEKEKCLISPFTTYVINCKSRPDRLKKFNSICPLKYQIFSGIEGRNLISTPQLQQIFEGNDYNMRRGMVGIALSHIQLIINLLNSPEEMCCILEDDVTFISDFKVKIKQLLLLLSKIDWDFVYLGHCLYPKYRKKNKETKSSEVHIEKFSSKMSISRSAGGFSSYLINKKGAQKFLQYINSRGMTNGIDTMQQKSIDGTTMNTYYCFPHLMSAKYVGIDKGEVDSDIQYDFSSLSISIEEKKKLVLRPDRLKKNGKWDITDSIKFK